MDWFSQFFAEGIENVFFLVPSEEEKQRQEMGLLISDTVFLVLAVERKEVFLLRDSESNLCYLLRG